MGPAEKRPQGPLKAAPNPLTLSPPQSMPSERRLVKRLIIDTNAAQPSDFEAMVPALPPLSGGHKSPPNVPWVGHKQLDNLKAARERSLGRGKRSSFDGKSEAAGEGKAGAEEQLGALSTQGNSYSHENEVGAPSAQEAVPKGRKSPYARLLREGVEAERLQPVVTRARAKTPSKLRPAGHEERLVVGGESSGAHEENGENRTR